MICSSAQLTIFENFNLSAQIGSHLFNKKRNMEEDVIFTNPYRKSKSDEDQNLDVSETDLV